ncbi:MAG TPA: substrate-binding domain-containing protein [Vicinamibacteria bacterium]
MKKALAVLLVLAAGVALWDGRARAQARSIRIALVAKSEANFVFLAARRGAEEKAAALSKAHGAPIEVTWLTPTKEDAAQQVERVRQAVRDKANAILLSASDAEILAPAVDAAVEAGVEVMTFDSDVPGSKRFAFYGADDSDLGEKVAGDLVSLLGGKGQVAILAGSPDANNLKARADAVKKALARNPGIEVMGVVNHVETPAEAVSQMLKFDAAHPQLAGWALVGGWPLFRSSQSPALMGELQKRALKVVAVDALPEQLIYVERGLVPVLWAQPVYDWGAIGVATIVDKLLLKKTVPRNIRMELIRVTRDDIRGYAKRLNSWGFTVPQEYLSAR